MLEAVMEEAKGHLTIIAHVACNNTQDSQELAAHAESLGVDAIQQFHRFILNFLNIQLLATGTIFQALLQIPIL